MDRYATIENGVVTNVSHSTAEVAAERGNVLIPRGFSIGDLYDGSVFTKKPFDAEEKLGKLVYEATRLLRESAWMQDDDIAPQQRVEWGQWRSALRDVKNLLVDDVTQTTTIPDPPAGVEFELPNRPVQSNGRSRSLR